MNTLLLFYYFVIINYDNYKIVFYREKNMDTEEEGDQESPNCEESEIDDSDRSSSSETESSGSCRKGQEWC